MLQVDAGKDFKKTNKYLEKIIERYDFSKLKKYGEEGVKLLEEHTPKKSGETAESWYYTIEHTKNSFTLYFSNSHVENGWFRPAIFLQFGHASKNGHWVDGIDYINPTLRPLFEKIAEDIWKEVKVFE